MAFRDGIILFPAGMIMHHRIRSLDDAERERITVIVEGQLMDVEILIIMVSVIIDSCFFSNRQAH